MALTLCGAWIMQFRAAYFGFLLQEARYPSPEGAALEAKARDLLEGVIAACQSVLDEDTRRTVNASGFVPDEPEPEPGSQSAVTPRFVDGVWISRADDEVCLRHCNAQRRPIERYWMR